MPTVHDTPVDRVILPSLETPTLTKAELAELLFERLGLNKRESKDMVEAFFELVHDNLVNGEDVKLSGFGNFNIRRKAPRPGRNPRTGERSRSRRATWSLFTPATSSRPSCKETHRWTKTSSRV
jgi:integration host factor subunit alpha